MYNKYLLIVAVEVRRRKLYIPIVDFEKWCLKFLNNFDVIVHVVLDCLLKSCKTFNGHSAHLVLCAYHAALNSNSGN